MSAPSAVRFGSTLVGTARTLHAGGWSPGEIRDMWIVEGVDPVPSRQTILRWVDEAYAERVRGQERRRHRRAHRSGAAGRERTYRLRGRGPEFEEGLVERLADEAVPKSSIAKVTAVLLGPENAWTIDRVRAHLATPGARRRAA